VTNPSSSIDLVIDQKRRDLGGFEVGRVLPSAARRMVGPFVFFDHMGPADFQAGLARSVDVRPHPHIGLSTISYLFEGEIMHRDSVGSAQAIRPGEVNWMTAGRGITHSERFEKARAIGDRLNGIQAWIGLPDAFEETDPGFSHHDHTGLPAFDVPDARVRLVAGTGFGLEAAVPVFSPLVYAHVELDAGATFGIPPDHPERAVYIARGSVEIDHRTLAFGNMAILTPGGSVAITAHEPSTLMLLGGDPIGHRYLEWNFVSSSRERLAQAKADWRAGRMKLPDMDHDEFIPLPDPGRV
jgi:redox-sensitive bicupin YhaK (pirin superfamily)